MEGATINGVEIAYELRAAGDLTVMIHGASECDSRQFPQLPNTLRHEADPLLTQQATRSICLILDDPRLNL